MACAAMTLWFDKPRELRAQADPMRRLPQTLWPIASSWLLRSTRLTAERPPPAKRSGVAAQFTVPRLRALWCRRLSFHRLPSAAA